MNIPFSARAVRAVALLLCVPTAAMAATAGAFTSSSHGLLALAIFALAYGFVITEEFLHLRKSKPVIVAAGVIWLLAAAAFALRGDTTTAAELLRHNLLEFAELMLFILAAMTYINTIEERGVFHALKSWMVSAGFSLRTVYWLTGVLAFFISPLADNLTTALVLAAVVLAVGDGYPRFVALCCVNIVVAANAGGAFSPFGDITTLMVWQKGVVRFHEFFVLFVPSLVNWLVPATLMAFTVPRGRPRVGAETIVVKKGGYVIVALFVGTIAMTVALHQFLHLPPFLGMMTGLGVLKVFGYFIRRDELLRPPLIPEPEFEAETLRNFFKPSLKPFDIYISMKRAEWDTLMFFYGVMLCVGGLGAFGYLAVLSESLYVGLGATWANVLIGIVSAVIDNIPVMFAVLTMDPEMSLGQWLLVTLTAGVGGSLLSIGSAAGVALMGQARGVYTFFSHLKWTWAIALGYAASIWVHLLLNG